jgi:hypothetical protein
MSEPADLAKFALAPLDHAIAAGEREALKRGVPTHAVIEMLLNHLASVSAMVEPPQAREGLVRDVVGAFAGLVRQHVEARYTTAGGVLLPQPQAQAQ